MEFTRFHVWMDYAAEMGLTPAEAYGAWREESWEKLSGRSYRTRRRGTKGAHNKYHDASTATEDNAS